MISNDSFVIIGRLHFSDLDKTFKYDAAGKKDIIQLMRDDDTVMVGFDMDDMQIITYGGVGLESSDEMIAEVGSHLDGRFKIRYFENKEEFLKRDGSEL